MSQTDTGMYKPFIWVLGALVVFTFLIGIIANKYSPKSGEDPLVQQLLKQQIAPVGQSRVEQSGAVEQPETVAEVKVEKSEPEQPAAETVVAETESSTNATDATVAGTVAATAATVAAVVSAGENSADTGEAAIAETVVSSGDIPVKVKAVVATNCAGCHMDGVRGAPRNDDTAAWSALAEKGHEALTQSVINGKGAMPPRAETTLSDDELGLAVQHMLAQNAADTATATAPVEAEEAVVENAVVEPVTAVAEAAPAAVASVAAIPDNVKGVVDSLCASCHISGVANAPKYGDKAAWDERMSVGIDKVLANAIAGKGVMPARGGSQLSDAELRLAIEYMATK